MATGVMGDADEAEKGMEVEEDCNGDGTIEGCQWPLRTRWVEAAARAAVQLLVARDPRRCGRPCQCCTQP